MREMTVRKKMVIAYVAAAIAFLAAVEFLSSVRAHPAFFVVAAAIVAGSLFAYATRLKCPHCHAKAFSRRWLALLYIPKACVSCDRDFYD